jgi:chemotaxis protein CheX
MATTETPSTNPVSQQLLVEAIRAATHEVFTTMLNLEPLPGEVFVEQAEPAPTSGVVSLVGLAGEWLGSGSLFCTSAFACRIASQLLQTEYQAIDEDVLDAVAEVTNMIIGNVKAALEEHLGPLGLSTPTVIYGRNFQTRSAGKQKWTVVPFSLEGDRMFVQVCIAPNSDAARRTARAGFPIPHVIHI